MQTARMAASASDQYTLFAHIRAITPKVPRQYIRLRGTNGELLGPAEAADMIEHWLQQIYDVPCEDYTSCVQAFNWPFTPMELELSFRRFSASKALANEYVPAVIWKDHSSEMATLVELLPTMRKHQAGGKFSENHVSLPVFFQVLEVQSHQTTVSGGLGRVVLLLRVWRGLRSGWGIVSKIPKHHPSLPVIPAEVA